MNNDSFLDLLVSPPLDTIREFLKITELKFVEKEGNLAYKKTDSTSEYLLYNGKPISVIAALKWFCCGGIEDAEKFCFLINHINITYDRIDDKGIKFSVYLILSSYLPQIRCYFTATKIDLKRELYNEKTPFQLARERPEEIRNFLNAEKTF